VVSEPGSHLELGTAAMTMPPDKLDSENRPYIPETKRKIFGATRLIESGQRENLKLTAPSAEGEYEYVCTFPGHAILMWGRLVVTKDVEAYLTENPTPKPLNAVP
jgi:azurin